jgi:hypothetical protein
MAATKRRGWKRESKLGKWKNRGGVNRRRQGITIITRRK